MIKRLLITGGAGFTGKHLSAAASEFGFDAISLQSNLLDREALSDEILNAKPTHVVHLAALSAVSHPDQEAFYKINLFGCLNLLDALTKLPITPKKILLASSANVYGNISNQKISESTNPKPVNHYAMSKLAMEYMSATYTALLPLIFSRPFNYTGVGHDTRFVIPKIVEHFRRNEQVIELGNLDVYREYNDVRMVCEAYLKLLEDGDIGEAYNICSGRTYSLREVIELTEQVAGKKIEVKVNPGLIRLNEVHTLAGNPDKLNMAIGNLRIYELKETLSWMLNSN